MVNGFVHHRTQNAAATITKQATYRPSRDGEMATVSESIDYVIVVTNTGNVDLMDISVVDDMFKTFQGMS